MTSVLRGHARWLLLVALSGCYGTGQSTGARKIVSMPQAPRGECQTLGELTGRSGGFFGAWYEDSTLAESATNDLTNQAAERDATHLHTFAPTFINNEAGRHDRAEVRGVAYRCTGDVTYGGESMLGARDARAAQAGERSASTQAPAGHAAAPASQASAGLAAGYGLGRAQAADGCLPGYVYTAKDGSKVPDEYGTDAAASELWGCGWNIALRDGMPGFPGARADGWYVVRHQGVFAVPASGEYVFNLDGGHPWRLTIDGRVFTGTGSTPLRLSLGAGEHTMLLEYLYLGGRAFRLAFHVTRPGGTAMPFTLERSSPFYAVQTIRYAGARDLGERWRTLATMEEGEIRILEQVHFETDSAQIKKEGNSEAVLYAVAKTLGEHPDIARVEVQGHTDDQGNDTYNLDLSQRRAVAVRKWLVDAGIAPHRLSARGYGKTRPLSANASDAGRALNRRVQFVIEGAAGAQPAAADATDSGRETDLRVLIAGPILGPSTALADLLPPVVGAYQREELETRVHEQGLSAAAIYRGPNGDSPLVMLATSTGDVLLRDEFTREVAGVPASEADSALLHLSPRTGLLVTTLRDSELVAFVTELKPARLRRLAEQRVDALPKKPRASKRGAAAR